MARRMAAVRRMAVAMAATDGLLRAKILSGSEFKGNPISEAALDAKKPVGIQSDGGRYFIHVRQDGRGQIMIHWPNGIEKTIKFLIPEEMLADRPMQAVPVVAELRQNDAGEGPVIASQKPSESVGCGLTMSKEVQTILVGMAVVCLVLALVKFPALWPYQLARWAVCAGAAWCAYHSVGWRRGGGGVLAVLYNPIQPIAFGNLWPWVNGFTATLLLAVVMGDSKKSCAVWSQRIGRVVVCAVLYALAFGLLIVLASTCWALSARYFGERVMKDGFAEWNLFGARASYEHVVMAQIAGWILAGVSALVILPLLWKWCWWRPVVAIHRALVRKEGPRITK